MSETKGTKISREDLLAEVRAAAAGAAKEAAQREHAAVQKGIDEIKGRMGGSGFSPVAETRAGEIDALTQRVEDYKRQLDEEAKARKAKEAELDALLRRPVTDNTKGFQGAVSDSTRAAGAPVDDKFGMGRLILAHALKERDKSCGTIFDALNQRGWGTTATTLKRKLDSATGGSGADIIPEQYAAEFIEYLRPATVVRGSGARSIPVPLGNLDMGRQNGTMTMSWNGDGVAPNESSLTTGRTTFLAKKMIGVQVLSNDLIRRSSPGADGLVQEDAVRAAAVEEDGVLLRSLGSSNKPKGIRYQAAAANVFAANVTYNYTNAIADQTKMTRLVAEGNVPMNNGCHYTAHRNYFSILALAMATLQGQAVAGALMSGMSGTGLPAGAVGGANQMFSPGTLMGYPIYLTTTVPTNLGAGSDSEWYFGNPTMILIGDTLNMQVAVDPSAAYVNASGTVVSAFSQDETAVRIVYEFDMQLRHTKSFAVLTGVNYL